jgi:hypothetical protein
VSAADAGVVSGGYGAPSRSAALPLVLVSSTVPLPAFFICAYFVAAFVHRALRRAPGE